MAGLWLGEAAAEPEPLHLGTHDQAPYGSYQADKKFDGLAVRMMACVLKRMGRSYVFDVYPWARVQLMAERGEVDGFFPATLRAERLVWAQATDVIADQKWVWYLPAGSKLDPLSAEFKATAKVGAHLGSNRLKMLEEQKYQVVLRPASDEMLLRAFVRGDRADAILGGDLAIAMAMKEQGVDPKSLRTVVAQDSPLHAYFGRKFLLNEPDFVVRFNAQLPYCR
jgi:polar amino acid transport system substrate-binding protein